MPRERDDVTRLLAKYPDRGDGCWEIAERYRGRDEYGAVVFGGKQMSAPRAMYLAFVGPIPDGHDVCHRCDNPPCGRPDHLFPGTRLENLRDAVRKGRMYKKLTLAKDTEAYTLRQEGATYQVIADALGVTKRAARLAVIRETRRRDMQT